MQPGGGEPSAQPSTGALHGRAVAKPVYQPQQCRLCDRPTVYLTRSGLLDHATVHHAHWYSAKQDCYVPIPEEDLEAKRRLIQDNQAHRKFRKDPEDKGKGRSRAPSRIAPRTGRIRRPRRVERPEVTGMAPPPAGTGRRRQQSLSSSSSRRVYSCVVTTGVSSSTATATMVSAPGTAFDAEHPQSSEQELGFAPSVRPTRPEGFPEAGGPVVPYLPPPVEDDTVLKGMDEHGMVPEIVVDLEQEVKDLNTDLLTTD